MRYSISLLVLLVVGVACGGSGDITATTPASEQTTSSAAAGCPDTVEDGGLVEGIDLEEPDWLPEGFPLPGDISLRHLNGNYLGEQDILTGFVPGGDTEVILAALTTDLAQAGYEQLLAADGFTPVANEALVVVSEPLEILVTAGVADQEAPVRVGDDECPWVSGVLVSFRFEPADVGEARLRYSGASLTQGVAQATVGGGDFSGSGECLIFADLYSFGSTSGDLIGVQFEESASGTVGFASVNAAGGDAIFNLAVDDASGTEPIFSVLESGFSVEGRFIDGIGDAGRVDGRVLITCG